MADDKKKKKLGFADLILAVILIVLGLVAAGSLVPQWSGQTNQLKAQAAQVMQNTFSMTSGVRLTDSGQRIGAYENQPENQPE